MADFNPDSADKKQVMHILTAKHQHIASIIDNSPPRGFVTWDASAPKEKDFYGALQTGLAFLRTDCTDEWCVLGNGVFALVRGMDIFSELEAVEIACEIIYVGNIRKMKVYLRPWPAQPSVEFYVGHGNECVKAVALNTMAFGDEQARQNDRAEMQPAADLFFNGMLPEPNHDYEEAVHRDYQAAAAAAQRDRDLQAKEEAGSPLWRAMLGAFMDVEDEPNREA
jgi:hypothetical protein